MSKPPTSENETRRDISDVGEISRGDSFVRRYSRGVTFGPRLSVAERSSSERRGVVNDQVGSRVPVLAMAKGIWADGDVGGGLGIGTRVPSEVLGSLYIFGSRRIPRPSASSESEPH